ncbi:gamma-glutamyltransferase [Acetobacter sp. AN02]|uniref:gamma-glutamyltransferase n=1 Tax=Acetobacter sp. AN02 TaxID=2894186 RepID=UPI00243459E8|nr:gamma-glutamyltransferase [Acetobacter sp. AN02]MDG6094867.1 gamma-glutamyltransferase [Acetobacter sp. AN02]
MAEAAPSSGAPDPLAFGQNALNLAPLAPAHGNHGMVVSAQHLASEVGRRILTEGGNAADAAVAVGYALAVVYPAAGNIGGGGFMLLRPPGKSAVFIDFREHAPLAATETMYQDAKGNVIPDQSITGWKAVAVPGTVAGMEMVRSRWGKLSRQKDLAPAIELAEKGFILGEGDVELLHTSTEQFLKDPAARKIFLHADGSPLNAGDRLVQSELASTLEQISKHGPGAFYDGPISDAIVAASQANGGILQKEDFRRYRVRELPPLTCTYRGYHIETSPPPSGGGVALCEMLEILSGYDMASFGLHSPVALHYEIEAMRRAYADRQDLGDPAFVKNPLTSLSDPSYTEAARKAIPADKAMLSADMKAGEIQPEKHETTHYSVIDRSGFAVSTTYTLNGWFGAGVIAGNTGFFLNDEMDDFASKPGAPNMFGIVGSKANAIAPGKTPLSSMAPTIISKDGKPVMIIGSPGGSRIPTIILSVILGVIDYGLDIQQAIDLPRIHEQWEPGAVEMESGAVSPETAKVLQKEGYTLTPHKPWGIAEGILTGGPRIGQAGSGYYGGFDRRHEGGAAAGE